MGTRARVVFQGADQTVTLYLPFDGDPQEVKARIKRARDLSTNAWNTGDLAAMFCYASVESAMQDLIETFGPDTGLQPEGNVVQICQRRGPLSTEVQYCYRVSMQPDGSVFYSAVNSESGKVLYHGPFDDCPTSYWQEDE